MKKWIMGGAVILSLMLSTGVAFASHSWGPYHWARTSNPFTLNLVDNVPSTWDPYLNEASYDWSLSEVLDTAIGPGNTSDRCNKPKSGQVKVCAAKYGANGWLGQAGIWVNSDNHITAGVTKMNDTYFNTTKYNTPGWRDLVMCQEIGHTFGLDHQDETFNNPNLGTCMDYTNNPDGPPANRQPNQHDYDQLAAIYGGHVDGSSTLTQSIQSARGRASDGDGDVDEDLGAPVHSDPHGRPNVFAKDLGGGAKKITWILWTEPDTGHP